MLDTHAYVWPGINTTGEQPLAGTMTDREISFIDSVERGTYLWDTPPVFRVEYDTESGHVTHYWTAAAIRKRGPVLARGAGRGFVWNIAVTHTGPVRFSGCAVVAQAAGGDWTFEFGCFREGA
jgi:hypothetical protein